MTSFSTCDIICLLLPEVDLFMPIPIILLNPKKKWESVLKYK